MKQHAVPSGIILDEPYTNGLLAKALEAGHARITFQSDYTTSILKRAWNPAVGQKALEMLLLYDKAYVASWFDNTDAEPLIELGLLEFVESRWNKATIDEDYARSIKALLLADLRRKGVRLTLEQFDDLLPDVNAMYVGNIMILAERLGPSIERIFGSSQHSSRKQGNEFSLVGEFRDQVEVARRRTPEEFELAQKIQASHRHLRDLLDASAALNVPIFSSIKRVPPVKMQIDLERLEPNARIAVSIYMKESLAIPKIQTVDDVLRLRNDSRIKYFRAKIFEWCEKLRAGEFGSEEAIRTEIREANAAIKDLGKYRTIGMWVTFLSVPLGVAGFLLGMPPSLAITTPLGVAFQIARIQKERQYRWLLFGR